MRLVYHHDAEIMEPSLSLVGAVADDEVIAAQGLVAHIVAHFRVGVSRLFLAENDGILRVANRHCANTHVVVEIHINSLAKIARFDVRMAHVTVGKRAFDVDFVLVVDEIVRTGFLAARSRYQSDKQDCEY